MGKTAYSVYHMFALCYVYEEAFESDRGRRSASSSKRWSLESWSVWLDGDCERQRVRMTFACVGPFLFGYMFIGLHHLVNRGYYTVVISYEIHQTSLQLFIIRTFKMAFIAFKEDIISTKMHCFHGRRQDVTCSRQSVNTSVVINLFIT